MYAKVSTGEVLKLAEVKALHPNVSFPADGPAADWMADNDLALVVNTDKPAITEDQEATLDGAALVDGEWSLQYTVTAKTYTAEELTEYTEEKYRSVIFAPITMHGITIVPDDKTLGRINNKVQAMRIRNNPAETATWLGEAGPVQLTQAQLEDIGIAADEQWQPVFTALTGIFADIQGGTHTTKADIDAALAAA